MNLKDVQVLKVMRCENKADSGTKDVSADVLNQLMVLVNFEEQTRRHPKASKVALGAQHESTVKSNDNNGSRRKEPKFDRGL